MSAEPNPWEGERPWSQADFAPLDAALQAWASAADLILVREDDAGATRYVHITTGHNECFSISVEAPFGAFTTVRLWSVETRDDEEFHLFWRCEIDSLGVSLNRARELAEFLGSRPRASDR